MKDTSNIYYLGILVIILAATIMGRNIEVGGSGNNNATTSGDDVHRFHASIVKDGRLIFGTNECNSCDVLERTKLQSECPCGKSGCRKLACPDVPGNSVQKLGSIGYVCTTPNFPGFRPIFVGWISSFFKKAPKI